MSLILSGTDGLSDVDGTAAAPAIRGTDTNTGIFFPAADQVAISTGGTQRAVVDASGNLLVGTTSTLGAKFALYGTASGTNSVIQITNPGQGTGCLGVLGTSSNFKIYNCYSSGTLGTGAGIDIDTSGKLLVGVTSDAMPNAGFALQPAEGNLKFRCGGANSYTQFYNQSNTQIGGITTNGTTVSYGSASDYRLKESIQPMTGALAKVALLKPCTYKWKVDGSDGQGFIAHELDEVVPGCVTGEKDAVETYTDSDGNEATRPVYQGIDTSFLVATLTAAIQEQQALITALTTRITALEGAAA